MTFTSRSDTAGTAAWTIEPYGAGIRGRIGRTPPTGKPTVTTFTGAPASPLEGTRWRVRVSPDKQGLARGERAFDDELVFTLGRVGMTACIPYGFQPSDYVLRPLDEKLSFKCQQESPSEGKAVWSGEFRGETLKGVVITTKRTAAWCATTSRASGCRRRPRPTAATARSSARGQRAASTSRRARASSSSIHSSRCCQRA